MTVSTFITAYTKLRMGSTHHFGGKTSARHVQDEPLRLVDWQRSEAKHSSSITATP